jgi:hypothetical protein
LGIRTRALRHKNIQTTPITMHLQTTLIYLIYAVFLVAQPLAAPTSGTPVSSAVKAGELGRMSRSDDPTRELSNAATKASVILAGRGFFKKKVALQRDIQREMSLQIVDETFLSDSREEFDSEIDAISNESNLKITELKKLLPDFPIEKDLIMLQSCIDWSMKNLVWINDVKCPGCKFSTLNPQDPQVLNHPTPKEALDSAIYTEIHKCSRTKLNSDILAIQVSRN